MPAMPSGGADAIGRMDSPSGGAATIRLVIRRYQQGRAPWMSHLQRVPWLLKRAARWEPPMMRVKVDARVEVQRTIGDTNGHVGGVARRPAVVEGVVRVLRFGVIVMVAGLQPSVRRRYDVTEPPVADVQIDMGVADLDGDGLTGDKDNCPEVDNPKQEDLDEDGTGDACDLDDDGDGVLDEFDTCPALANPDRLDSDGDGRGDACDDDDDNDEFPDDVDVCPLIPNADQKNTDGDDYGDVCDDDRDSDTWLNERTIALTLQTWASWTWTKTGSATIVMMISMRMVIPIT